MDRWLLGAAFAVVMALAGGWGSAIHGQLSSINAKLDTLVATQASLSTDLAVLRIRVERLERGIR